MRGQQITVNSRKFDLSIRRSWNCRLIERNGLFLLFKGEFENEVRHPDLGIIRPGTISYEYYWLGRWYNIFRFHEPDGSLRNYYCNINMPPTFENGVLDYVDLDIDVLVWPAFRYEVVDEADFEANATLFGYSDILRLKVYKTLDEIIGLIEKRKFPFDASN